LQKICHETGRSAISEYRVIEHLESSPASRVIFMPITGRTHQLRIHSREIGHPILGCDLYAYDEAFNMADRLMLHATTLSFDHPITGQKINGHCPCPF
ncbi:MAG: RluA family pseudouridine synthase, partial [Cellvibrionales bacterium]|nr:RluA family pseudouridine synthase [Cellvibrionales bacterium]